MRHLFTTAVLAGAIVLGLSGNASAGGDFNGPGYNGGGFNGPGFQGPGFQGPGFQGPGFQGPGFQGPGFQGPGFQGPGYNSPVTTVKPDDTARHCNPEERDTAPDVKTWNTVPRRGLRLNGVILGDPASTTR